MKRVTGVAVMAAVLVSIVAGACATQSVSPPAPPAPQPAAPAPRTAPSAPASSPEAAAWAKVVEAAKKEGSVTLYSYAFTGDLGLALSQAFKQRYGINVEIITGRGSEMVERIKIEQRMKSVTADIQEGSSTHNLNSKLAGSSIATLDIPALAEPKTIWHADPLNSDTDGHVISYGLTIYTPYYNAQLIKPADMPRSYKDFLNPRWKGKILASDPEISITEYNHFLPLLEAKVLDEEFIRALGKQDLQFVTGEVQRGEKLSRGEAPITTTGSTASMSRFIGPGAPVRAQRMSEGIVANTVSMVRIKNSPHPYAARVFTNWLLSAEGQDIHGKMRFMGSIRKDVTDYTPEAGRSNMDGVVVMNAEQEGRTAGLFRDKWLSKMWRK